MTAGRRSRPGGAGGVPVRRWLGCGACGAVRCGAGAVAVRVRVRCQVRCEVRCGGRGPDYLQAACAAVRRAAVPPAGFAVAEPGAVT